MGGQACVLYGAAEFSRDVDLVFLLDEANLEVLKTLLTELGAKVTDVPPFEQKYLQRGHSVHFWCYAPGDERIRLDLMAKLRGVDPFPELWERRTTAVGPEGETYELLSLPDLILAKKTQRDKDWPMIRRLVEADFFRGGWSEERCLFWLRELRTPELLVRVATDHPELAARVHRAAVVAASTGDVAAVEAALIEEERLERQRDRDYWVPLRRELEELRRERRRRPG
jgi:hypothetical protein